MCPPSPSELTLPNKVKNNVRTRDYKNAKSGITPSSRRVFTDCCPTPEELSLKNLKTLQIDTDERQPEDGSKTIKVRFRTPNKLRPIRHVQAPGSNQEYTKLPNQNHNLSFASSFLGQVHQNNLNVIKSKLN